MSALKFLPAVFCIGILAAGGIFVQRLRSERDQLLLERAGLLQSIEIYQANLEAYETLQAETDQCLGDIAFLQDLAAQWQARYSDLRSRPARVIEIPIAVAPPGLPCEEAVRQLAEFLEREVSHDPSDPS